MQAELDAAAAAAKKSKWQLESNAFRASMRAAREVTKAIATGAPLPPPVASAPDPSLVQCPHCSRRCVNTLSLSLSLSLPCLSLPCLCLLCLSISLFCPSLPFPVCVVYFIFYFHFFLFSTLLLSHLPTVKLFNLNILFYILLLLHTFSHFFCFVSQI